MVKTNQYPRVQFRTLRSLYDDLIKRAGLDDKINETARKAVERYYTLLADEYDRLANSKYFTVQETLCIIEACRGISFYKNDPKLLGHFVEDGIVQRRLAEKWEIDGEVLLDKIRNLSPTGKHVMSDVAEKFWVIDRQQRENNIRELSRAQNWPDELIKQALQTFGC